MVDRGDRHEDRPVAGSGGGGEDERQSGLHRGTSRPRGALLWRGQSLCVRRVAGDVVSRDRGVGGGGRDLRLAAGPATPRRPVPPGVALCPALCRLGRLWLTGQLAESCVWRPSDARPWACWIWWEG